jgi:hypothetical protein
MACAGDVYDAHACPWQVTTFTDCVNCLIAFTNNPHSLDVSLNAIAFLRFCAMKLAEGAIGTPQSHFIAGSPTRVLTLVFFAPIQGLMNCFEHAWGYHSVEYCTCGTCSQFNDKLDAHDMHLRAVKVLKSCYC